MQFDSMRFTAAAKNSPLSDVVIRSLTETGDLSIAGMRTGFRSLAPLYDKAQVEIDKKVVEVGLQRLTFVADLMTEGLVFPLSDPFSITQLEWYQRNKTGAAQRSMTPSARTENKQQIMLPNRLPIYLTMDGFELDIRTLKMSQRVGAPLDLANVMMSTRSVNEALEDAAINGATTLDGQDLVEAGYKAPGLLNAPNANDQSLSIDWTAAAVLGTTGPAMLADVQAMMSKLAGDKKYGPYNLYVGTTAGIVLDNDFKANGDLTIKQRLEQIVAGGRNLKVRVADFMPGAATGKQCVLVQMTSDVVELVQGQAPTVIPWTSLDGFTIHNLVMAIQVPRVRSDYDGNSGVCTGTK